MTVESALSSVQASAGRLHEAVGDLVLMAVEDRPRGPEVHLVTIVHDAALDLAGEAAQALALLPADVAGGHEHINALGAVLVRELACPERLRELARLGAERGREAGAWAREIVRCVQACQRLLWTDMQPALLAYWREIAGAGRQVSAPATPAGAEREGRGSHA